MLSVDNRPLQVSPYGDAHGLGGGQRRVENARARGFQTVWDGGAGLPAPKPTCLNACTRRSCLGTPASYLTADLRPSPHRRRHTSLAPLAPCPHPHIPHPQLFSRQTWHARGRRVSSTPTPPLVPIASHKYTRCNLGSACPLTSLCVPLQESWYRQTPSCAPPCRRGTGGALWRDSDRRKGSRARSMRRSSTVSGTIGFRRHAQTR